MSEKFVSKTSLEYFFSRLKTLFATKADIQAFTPSSVSFPVGSIYFSISSTNPTVYFGGTWQLFGEGRTPVGLPDIYSAMGYAAGDTGGEKAHVLTTDEMPSHTHTYANVTTTSNHRGPSGNANEIVINSRSTTASGAAGSGTAHNNLQPYITCYIWERTA